MTYYEFIKVDSTIRHVNKPEKRLSSSTRNVYIIKPKFKTCTEVHIGSGKKRIRIENNSVSVILLHQKDSKGDLIIPGSSFKGAVATNFLALSGLMELTSNLFGATKATAVISKVFFSDLVPNKKIEPKLLKVSRQWKPRKSRKGFVKVYVKKAPLRRKEIYLECIPRGTVLQGNVVGYNLKDYEIGGILASFGFGFKRPRFKIGYAKPQGLGQMELVDVEISKVGLKGLRLSEIKLEPKEKSKFLNSFRELCERRGREIAEIGRKIFVEVV